MHRLFEVRSRLTALRVAAAVVLVGTPGLLPASASQAEEIEAFTATARAEGGRINWRVPDFLIVEEFMDGGGPVAQSVVETYNTSSFASLPYPGDTAVAGPGTLGGLIGQDIPFVYPFYVSASYPTAPEESLADPSGSYALAADAQMKSATGTAQFKPQQGSEQHSGSGGAKAVTSIVAEDGKVTAVAETTNEALNLGEGALRVASVRSRSISTYVAGDTAPGVTTNLVVEGGAAGGYTFAFGGDGLTVANQGVPVPAASGLEQINTVLAPAGISIDFSDEERLADGAAAQALEVSMRRDATTDVPGTVVTMRFGGASTSISVAGQDFVLPVGESGTDAGDAHAPNPAQPTTLAPPAVASESPPTGATRETTARPTRATPETEPRTELATGFGEDANAAATAHQDKLTAWPTSDGEPTSTAGVGVETAGDMPAARMPLLPATPTATAHFQALHRGEHLYLSIGLGSALLLALTMAWSQKGVTSR